MKTFDGKNLIQDRFAKMLASYPEGSVTPRTVVAYIQLETDPEVTFNLVDAAITTQLINCAATVYENPSLVKRVRMSDDEINATTSAIVNAAYKV